MQHTSKTVLFYRNYHSFSGGHLITEQYFSWLVGMKRFRPRVYFTPDSSPIWQTPWKNHADAVDVEWRPESADILFFGGVDWRAVDHCPEIEDRIPVINLIQHVKHADPSDERYKFLRRRTIRICVSDQIADALTETGECNGPVFTLPNAVSSGDLPQLKLPTLRAFDVAIAAIKRPDLARSLAIWLADLGLQVDLIEKTNRDDFLNRLANARIAITLPRETEGFYLPAFEAMALGCLVVCPDCVGNRSFCVDGETCLMPVSYNHLAVQASALAALRMDGETADRMREQSWKTVEAFDIESNRQKFQDILRRLED